MGNVKEIKSKAEFDETISNSENLVVVDCYAVWCGPCRLIAPHIEKHSENYPGVDFYKIDVDQLPDVAADLGVRAMPTFIFFKGGEQIDNVVGANPAAIEDKIKEHQ